jgi:predicted transcriptional regulator
MDVWLAGLLYDAKMSVKVTFELSDRVRRALKQAALNRGETEKEIHERALRQYLGLDIVERLRERPSELSEVQATKVANEQVHAARKERKRAKRLTP